MPVIKSQPTVTRPADTTPYNAGDVLGGVIQFTGLPQATSYCDQLLTILSADLRAHIAAIPAGMTSFRLNLYSATPPSALADNAPWDLPAGDRLSYLGYIDIGSLADVGSTLFCQADGINRPLKLAAGESSIYGYLVTNGGFTPAANSEVYVPSLSFLLG